MNTLRYLGTHTYMYTYLSVLSDSELFIKAKQAISPQRLLSAECHCTFPLSRGSCSKPWIQIVQASKDFLRQYLQHLLTHAYSHTYTHTHTRIHVHVPIYTHGTHDVCKHTYTPGRDKSRTGLGVLGRITRINSDWPGSASKYSEVLGLTSKFSDIKNMTYLKPHPVLACISCNNNACIHVQSNFCPCLIHTIHTHTCTHCNYLHTWYTWCMQTHIHTIYTHTCTYTHVCTSNSQVWNVNKPQLKFIFIVHFISIFCLLHHPSLNLKNKIRIQSNVFK